MDRRRRTSSCAVSVALAVAVASLAALLAAFLGACGQSDGDLLSQRRASELRDSVDRVQELVESGDCAGATDAAQELEREADGLPDGVDSQLREALLSGADRLRTLVEERCAVEGTTGPTGPAVPAEEPQQQPEEDESSEPPGQQKKNEGQGKGKAKGKDKKTDTQQEEPAPPESDVVPPEDGGGGADGGSGGFAP